MIARTAFVLGFLLTLQTGLAAEPSCSLYKASGLMGANISREIPHELNARSGAEAPTIYIDVVELGEVVCVNHQEEIDGVTFAYVSNKLSGDDKAPVEGWVKLSDLVPLSKAEARAFGGGAPPAAAASLPAPAAKPAVDALPDPGAKAPPPVPAPPTPVAVAPPAAATAATAAAPAAHHPDDVLAFGQPVPFGPFPVNGRSIKSLAALNDQEESIPLFPPIEGLDDALWKKSCPTCHKWNEARLCEQGNGYVKTPRYALRHQHPFGGAYKIALMRWAKTGCK